MDATLTEEKKRLDQKKARLQAQEITFKIKERRQQLNRYIEAGKLAAKAEINHLNSHALLGAFLHLRKSVDRNPEIIDEWEKRGKEHVDSELTQKQGVILFFPEKTDKEMQKSLRSLGLKWNTFRREWFGMVDDVDKLKSVIEKKKHTLKMVDVEQE